MEEIVKTDCGVIGGGLAGYTVALELADAGKDVYIFSKGGSEKDCNSYLIAGGLTGVMEKGFDIHIKETLDAGKGLNNDDIVRYCVVNFYSEAIKWLIDKGVKFDKKDGKYDLSKEGSITQERVFHYKDKTGESIIETLDKLVREHPNITVYDNHIAIDLITKNKIEGVKRDEDICLGFYVYDIKNDYIKTVSSKGTFIATGGLGKVFMYTSNFDVSSGDGYAMCYRAGLPLANMEFVQFHPTVFYDPNLEKESERRKLMTEALRAEGAFLKLEKDSDEDFVLKYDPRGSRAPRDIVSRAIDTEIKSKEAMKHVWLDCTKIDEEILKTKFKNSYDFCDSKEINITTQPIPVVYAAHYSVGGVLTWINGETEMKGSYVIGETGYTGLHGANRLASNSAPECVLTGRNAARHFLRNYDSFENTDMPLWDIGEAKEEKDKATVEYYWDTIRRTMTSMCGVSRNKERLTAAKRVLSALREDINDFYWKNYVTKDFLEVRNIADVANVILDSALFREESRGCHYREDFENETEKYLGWTIVEKGIEPYLKKIGVSV